MTTDVKELVLQTINGKPSLTVTVGELTIAFKTKEDIKEYTDETGKLCVSAKVPVTIAGELTIPNSIV